MSSDESSSSDSRGGSALPLKNKERHSSSSEDELDQERVTTTSAKADTKQKEKDFDDEKVEKSDAETDEEIDNSHKHEPSNDLNDYLSRMGRRKESLIAMQRPKQQAALHFEDICYTLTFPMPANTWWKKLLVKIPYVHSCCFPKMKRQILHNVSGEAVAGEFLAIMGPTGSGKTTLLNILAGRLKTGVTGEIEINGRRPGRWSRQLTAYVLQDDTFFTNLTVRETLTYSAYLRLPGTLSFKEKRQRVEDVIQELGLSKCANTIIGGHFVRGVSGGERKRTNIGNELLMNPSLILLDEPTTGLDSSTALSLMITLKELAKNGRTVITTIHQPSSSMFHMFDRVLLLVDGRIAFYDEGTNVIPYFSKLGYSCSPSYNPADFLLELATNTEKTEDGKTVKEAIVAAYEEKMAKSQAQKEETNAESNSDTENDNSQNDNSEKNSVDKKTKKQQNSKKQKQDDANNADDDEQNDKKQPKFPTRWHVQASVLMLRAFKQHRGEALAGLNIVQQIVLALLVGLFWFQIDYTEAAINDRTGVVFFVVLYWAFYTWFTALYTFPPERAVLNKERAAGAYRLSAYYVGKTMSDVPLELLLPFLFLTIVYWMTGLNRAFYCYLIFLGIMFLLTILGTSIGLFLGAAVMDIKKALTFSTVAMLTLMLLGGFYIKEQNIPIWIRWVKWGSFIKYAYEALLINEFTTNGDHTWSNSNPSAYTDDPIQGSDILSHVGVETHLWWDVLVLLGMLLVARILGYLALRFLNRPKR